MNLTEFQDFLRQEVNRYSIEGRSNSSAFLMWFLEKIFGLDGDTAVSCVCDNKNDKGIDGIYVDNVEEEIHVFQSKIKEKNNVTIGDKVLRDFAGVKNWLKSSTSVQQLLQSNINNELRALINDNNLIEIIDEYHTIYHFVINGLCDDNTREYLKVNKDLELWDIELLMQRYYFIKDDPLVIDKKVFMNIKPEDKIILNIADNGKAIIFPVLAKELIKLKGIDDFTLFTKNVRYGLGNTRVNKAIRKTLQNTEEKNKFLLFHNGISLVCEKFEYDDQNNKVCVDNYSIVNGAQSTLTFYNNAKYLNNNVKVLLRIIEVGDNQNLTNQISIYNNNQNSIAMKDLRANDNVQRRLVKEFSKMNEQYGLCLEYIPKKGKKVDEGYDEISSDYAAQLITACYLNEPYNTHLKTSMFDSSYKNIFNRNINAYNLTMYFCAHSILKENLTKIKDKRIAAYGLAQFFLLDVLFKIIRTNEITEKITSKSDQYMKKFDEYNDFFKTLINTLIGIFNHYMDGYSKDEDFIYKNFFKSKDKVEKLESEMIGMFEASLSVNFKQYEDLCIGAGII